MELPHGSTNRQERITLRATRILSSGGMSGCEPDDTDINSDEAQEIEEARELAAKWATKGGR